MAGSRYGLVAVGLALGLLGAPAVAEGALLGRGDGSAVVYLAEPGETNELEVVFLEADPDSGLEAFHIFVDPDNVIEALSPCVTVELDPPDDDFSACAVQEGDQLVASLDDEADTALAETPFQVNFCGGSGQDILTGGDAADLLVGEGDSDILDGGAGSDYLIMESGCNETEPDVQASNVAEGGPGDDALIGGRGEDTLSGGEGGDTLLGAQVESGAAGDIADVLDGGEGNDSLVGHDGDDRLAGAGGDDLLAGGNGADQLTGGDGNDQLGVTVNQAFLEGDVLERVLTVEAGADLLDGGPGDDLLNGGPGATVLNFRLEGSISASETSSPNGPDDLVGGAGRDTVSYVNLALPVQASLDGVANDGSAGEADNVRPDNEVLIGGSAADTLTGAGANDTIDGGRGGDSIDGGGGDDALAGGDDDGSRDRLSGGEGADSLGGGPGDDALQGDGGADSLDGGGGADTAGGGDGSDRVNGGTGLDSLSGGPGDDRLRGAADGLVGADGADSLSGDGGDDDLDGGPGDDTLAGGPDADRIAGAEGRDSADYRGALGSVTVTLDGAPGDGANGEGDHILGDVEGARGGDERDTFSGNSGANTIEGGDGEDYIDGRAGVDGLDGGGGTDVLRGRDRAPDRVGCGTSRDFAIVDGRDSVDEDCEDLDDGGRRRARLARSMIVAPLSGSTGLRLAYGRRFVPLQDTLLLPLRSSLATARGAVHLTTAGAPTTRTAQRVTRQHTGVFSGGRFSVRQRRTGSAATQLRLQAGSFAGCGSGSRSTVRRLRGRGRGNFHTAGRRSVTVMRRGRWIVADRCDGTLTRVSRGRALVLDAHKRRVTVRARHSYLARAR